MAGQRHGTDAGDHREDEMRVCDDCRPLLLSSKAPTINGAERRERRRLLGAHFPVIKRLEDFRFADSPSVPQATSLWGVYLRRALAATRVRLKRSIEGPISMARNALAIAAAATRP